MDLIIPVASGLESTVKRQLNKLGYEKAPADNGRIQVEGGWQDVAKLNLWLRSGERVLLRLKKFHAETFDELYEGVYSIPWEEYLTVDSQILMNGKSYQSKLVAVKACGGVCKKAVIKRLADKIRVGNKTFSETGARTIVDFSLYRDEVTVSIDTSGDGLHKRGYRSLAYTAPLKETLASAIIENSFYNPDADIEKPFADIFCGSGTIPIEAGLLALNIAPGINRDFDFDKWKCTPKNLLKNAKEEAKTLEKRDRKPRIYGSDISKDAISIAEYHAKRAGLDKVIRFERADMRKFSSQEKYGVMISNPPYGERLLSEDEVKTLYRDLGKTFFSLNEWSGYFLTSFPDFERWFKKTADRKKKLYNANLTCSLYEYFGKKPEKKQK